QALKATFGAGSEAVWFLLDESDATCGEECDLLILTKPSAIQDWAASGAMALVNANYNGGAENGHAVGVGTNTPSLQYYMELRRQS
ncbi:MAG: hypothetical protein GWN18_19975, partial [Thermoplasmata archaeon]|nr:hypothetical protein [Thermoplasmata archaeon]NIS14406.1 hypothetical protein [Thermoplasmata archaeon]NIS22250.1 hypothetical protein [Thermoplasmata archaeon]NIT80133.1 hypothetical protein [Thermoplasmata archaeon]NIU51258.1 hypothetical protein [Thermoplasmata archaeon]